MIKKLFAVVLILPLLAGCVSVGNVLKEDPNVNQSLQNIGNFTMADLQNADAIAVKSNDVLAHQCFTGLEIFVAAQQASQGGASTNTVSGAISAFEVARTSLQAGNQLIDKATITSLEQACGPLQIDIRNNAAAFIAGLAALGIK